MYELAAIVILYNPDEKELTENINSYIDDVDRIYLIDNSTDKKISEDLTRSDKITYINNGKNLGLSKALNIGCRKAIEDSFEKIILFDQDSYATRETIPALVKELDHTDGIVCPNIKLINRDHAGKREFTKECYNYVGTNSKVDFAITSGLLFRSFIFNDVGGFDENLFLYHVDRDFCYKLQKKRYKIIKIWNSILYHEPGRMKTIHIIKWKLHIPNVTPNGCYHAFFGEGYMRKKNGKLYRPFKVKLWKNIISIIVFEREKIAKLRNSCMGYIDGCNKVSINPKNTRVR